MGWIALADGETRRFVPQGLGGAATGHEFDPRDPEELVVRGTLVIETPLPNATRPRYLIRCNRGGSWPFALSLQAIPGGALLFVLDTGSGALHQILTPFSAGRAEVLRLTYRWDAPARTGFIALEHPGTNRMQLLPVPSPSPVRIGDLRLLFSNDPANYVSPDVTWMAASTRPEPVGPLPSLAGDTPILTPRGHRPIRTLRRGDTVIDGAGKTVPVLQALSCTVPARGLHRPMRIRAPYFGLDHDIQVAATQRLILSGTDVEYLFGCEEVLAPAGALTGGHSVMPVTSGLLTTYHQLLLPGNESLCAAGTILESLNVGRLRRKPRDLSASLLSSFDRSTLPDHGPSDRPVLRGFDARVLTECRVA